MSGLHLIGLVAAGITLLAAIGVWLFLPARARDVESPVAQPVPNAEPDPVGVG